MGDVRVNVKLKPEETAEVKVRLSGTGYDRSIPGKDAQRAGTESVFVFAAVPEGVYTATLVSGGQAQVIFEQRVLKEPEPDPAAKQQVDDNPAARLQAANAANGGAGAGAGAAGGQAGAAAGQAGAGTFVPGGPPPAGSKFCTICRRPIATSKAAADAAAARAQDNQGDVAVGEQVTPDEEPERYDYFRKLIESMGSFSAAPGDKNLIGIRGFVDGRRVENTENAINDTIAAIWIDDAGEKQAREYLATVDPIKKGDKQDVRLHLLDGQWPFVIGDEHGRPCLVQGGPVAVFDETAQKREVGSYGLKIHCMGDGEFSASGSQLLAGNENGAAWVEFIELAKSDPDKKLLYTLVDGSRLKKDGSVATAEASPVPKAAAKDAVETKAKKDLSANKASREGHPIGFVVLYHSGHNDFARQLAWYKDPKSKASVHYLLGPDSENVQLVEEPDAAWHAGQALYQGKGNVNLRSIGIELVGDGDKAAFQEAQYKLLAATLQRIFDAYGLGIDDVVGHRHIAPTREGGPGSNFDWNRLRGML